MKLMSEVVGYRQAMARYATFSGRSLRSEFWYFTLVSGLIGFGASLIDDANKTGGILYLIVTLVHLTPSLAVFARRMHDTNRSGWWFLALFTVVGVIPVLMFLCQRGTPGSNRFGASPGSDGYPGGLVPSLDQLSGATARDPIREIERLADLRAKGAISDIEYARMKANVFGGHSDEIRIEPTL